MKLKVRGRAWKLDRMHKSSEPWEQRYKRRSRGLAYASHATRVRVARMGGKAHK